MAKKILRIVLMHILILSVLMVFVFLIPCPLYSIFKIPCPLCGMTRAIVAFFSGQFTVAFALHPLFVIFPFAVLFFCHARLIGKKIGKIPIIIISAVIILAFIIAYFVRDKSILETYPQPFLR